jgi:hypothetical protein
MPSVQSVKNQYVGVNAHLHSYLQSAGDLWVDFHGAHLAQLRSSLRTALLPLGYTAALEQSVQIRYVGEHIARPRGDLLVYDQRPPRPMPSVAGYTLEMPLEALIPDEDEDDVRRAIVIYEIDARTRERGDPVAWVELLSPSNKGSTSDGYMYLAKRRGIMKAGLVFVEIDYLNETPATLTLDGVQQSAYRIAVFDPRPVYWQGRGTIKPFGVDDPIPTLRIPLNDGDSLDFDFGQPYQKTFAENLYGYDFNYTQYPLNFDRYTPADQTRIANRMLAVLEAARDGLDLESGPFPAKTLSLDDALRQITALQQA